EGSSTRVCLIQRPWETMLAVRIPLPIDQEVALPRTFRFAVPFALLALVALPGCAAMNEVAALRHVGFAFSGVSNVRFVGIAIGPGASYSKLSVSDVARLAAAALAQQAPIE